MNPKTGSITTLHKEHDDKPLKMVIHLIKYFIQRNSYLYFYEKKQFGSINDPSTGQTYDISPLSVEKASRVRRDTNGHPHEISKRQVSKDEFLQDYIEIPEQIREQIENSVPRFNIYLKN